jgi:uroporphyrinogen III methyltransferase/synthase
LEVLRQAEVVLHDALSHPALLDACPSAELRNVGKRYGQPSPPQEWITAQLVELAQAGRRVVRLKGGDPFLFARGAEEALALAEAGIPFEIVPGISSPVAASAYAGLALTHRGLSSSVTFITGTDRDAHAWSADAWHRLATATDTLCILMGMRRIEEITTALVEGGRPASTPAAVVQWAARTQQRVEVGTLGDIAERARARGLTSPALIFVGEIVTLRDSLRWYDARPLFGKRVLVLRAEHQARETANAIRARGADALTFPVIEIQPPPDGEPLARAVRELSTYDWVVFTSTNGVDRFFAALDAQGLDARAFAAARIAAIGPRTAAQIEKRGLKPDAVAPEYVGESLAALLVERGAKRVLVPRARVARDALPRALEEAGVFVEVAPVYETVPAPAERAAELRGWLEDKQIDVVAFTSGSTVESLCQLLGADAPTLLADTCIASIGPITSRSARERGIRVDVEATTYTIDGLLDALEGRFSGAPLT